jgi:hypothetical protein
MRPNGCDSGSQDRCPPFASRLLRQIDDNARARGIIAGRRGLLVRWLEQVGGIKGSKAVPLRPRLWLIGANDWPSRDGTGPKPIGDARFIIARNAAAGIFWLIVNRRIWDWVREAAIRTGLFEKAILYEDIAKAMADEHKDA